MGMSMENIMESSLGEISSVIRATYKKTVFIRQYETEVVELETVLQIEEKLTGIERMLLSAILQAQLEYTAYCTLAFKGLVTNTELESRKGQLIQGVQALKDKAEKLLGKSVDHLFEHKDLMKIT